MNPSIKQSLSPKAIIIAIGGACLLYLVVLLLSLFNGSKTLEKLQSKMAAQSIAFDAPMSASENNNDKMFSENDEMPPVKQAVKDPLAPAPFEGLTEETQFGLLPMTSKNKLKPFDAYKKQYTVTVGKPIIALGITGIGYSDRLYQSVFSQLTPSVSLILSAYVDSVHEIQKEARVYGYETWLELPFENKNFKYDDPGPKGILTNAGLKFNQDNYRSVLASTAGYAGIAGYTDSAFKDAHTMLGGILSDIFNRGLGFFEMNSGRDSMSIKVAVNSRGIHIQSTTTLNDENISDRFSALKKIAKRDQRAVGILEVSPSMLEGFQNEILKAKQEGFEIVPLSAVADQF